ncbi:MAG: arylsulfatase [Myxococcales bacterium]|nr:arylsulfatase [Myxococcales bacterium]
MGQDGSFGGKIGRTVGESVPWWPEEPTPPAGSPNVVILLFDDTGFSHLGCYGSSIETPQIDRLAAAGLRFTNFHTTALCSPTRACLLTGRNHHAVGMRAVSNFDTGFPNMRGYLPQSAGTLAEILRARGYATLATGKWHLAPMEQCSAAGPFNHWPLQRGFERYYGFLQGETDQFYPELTRDNTHIDPPAGPEDGYHVTEDIIERSIGMIRDQKSLRPEQPFFLYCGFGATHAPHQAPPEYLAKYRGRFDAGWDASREATFAHQQELGIVPPGTELAPRNPGVKPWDELSDDERAFAARLQEAFAAFLDHTDAQIGRLIEFLRELGQLDNTLLILLSDNGASQEGGPTGVFDEFRYFNGIPEDVSRAVERLDDVGGPDSHTNYPWGWAMAGNTPLKRYKQNTHGGGVRDPLIVHWPARIRDAGGIRTQFHHVIDIAPSVLEAIGLEAPAELSGLTQLPMAGTSLVYTFDAAGEPTRKQTQYFEMFGHRGIWHEGWKAVAFHQSGSSFDEDQWELYHLDEDFSECRDLAEAEPEKLREMIDRWWVEAGEYGVLPLDDRSWELFRGSRRPGTIRSRREFTYYPPISHVPADASPPLGNRSWILRAEIERQAQDQGVLAAIGTRNCGLSFYVKDRRLVFDYNWFHEHTRVVSKRELPAGASEVAVHFMRRDEKAEATLVIDGEECGAVPIPRILRMISSTGLDVGRDGLSGVTDDYAAPFPFSGKIAKVVFELVSLRSPGEQRAEQELEAKVQLSRE